MRRLSVLVAIAVAVGGAGEAEASIQIPCDMSAERHKRAAFHVINAAYRHEKWRDPSLITNKQRNRITGHRKCLGDFGRKRVSRYRENAAESRDAWRKRKRAAWEAEQFQQEYRPYGPCVSVGYLAIPCYVAWCESRYRWYIHDGMYQIIPSTWSRYGGNAYASYPGAATPDEQSIIATRVLRSEGPNAWSCW